MAFITEIEPLFRHKKRLAIRLDEEPWAVLSQKIVKENGLQVGTELDGAMQEALLEADGKTAVQLCLWYLEQRAYTRAELERKLKEYGYTEENRDNAIARMMKAGYLNDAAVAEFAAEKYAGQSLGRRAVIQKLRMRGLDEETVAAAMENHDPEQEREAARALAARYWNRCAQDDPPKRKQKTAAALARKGFDWDVIRAALDALADDGWE